MLIMLKCNINKEDQTLNFIKVSPLSTNNLNFNINPSNSPPLILNANKCSRTLVDTPKFHRVITDKHFSMEGLDSKAKVK